MTAAGAKTKEGWKVADEKKVPLKIKACPTKETEAQLLKVEVESTRDLEKLAERLDVPIIECKEGRDMVIDTREKILFYKQRKE